MDVCTKLSLSLSLSQLSLALLFLISLSCLGLVGHVSSDLWCLWIWILGVFFPRLPLGANITQAPPPRACRVHSSFERCFSERALLDQFEFLHVFLRFFLCYIFFLGGGFEDLPTFCQISLQVEEEEEETHSSKISWYKTGRRNFLQRNCLKTELGGWIFVWGFTAPPPIKNPPHDRPLILIPPSPYSLFKLCNNSQCKFLNDNSFFFAIPSASVLNCMAFSLV